ncbi:Signal peptidase complex, subunit SPC25 [Handroanthus impetiginosus]|uniref:Signal peptidase complex subunit 2 n=1 Tax=Handroanthus impetiginosus TaxID=429701 RepID=A0A2G9HC50_9LAMI|nr:Signal peptidase complex, subunit SPC25 [Handroanthus impetiginosus]
MASNKNPKKANLLDHNSLKHILDESVTEIVTSKGYPEDVRMSNIRLLIGTIIIVIALFAQFYNKKFPENRNFLIGCIALYPFCLDERKELHQTVLVGYATQFDLFSGKKLVNICVCLVCVRVCDEYVVFNGILQLIIYLKEKNAILFTYPPPGSFNSTGLVITSKLPRFSDMYTLTIASADPQSISAKPAVQFTKSVTKWFAKDGVLVEGLFWKDVEALINDYAKETKKSK